jgi:hypothetical protein
MGTGEIGGDFMLIVAARRPHPKPSSHRIRALPGYACTMSSV